MAEERTRREILGQFAQFPCAAMLLACCGPLASIAGATERKYNAKDHYYGMGIQVDKCIGCGRCVEACKAENDVPRQPFYFRTWIERYQIRAGGDVKVDSPEGGINSFPATEEDKDVLRSFFVPKLCNHCDNPPCVQVCPVGATFKSQDGVVLVDKDYAATASRPARTARASSTPVPQLPTSARSATTESRKASCPPASRLARREPGYSAS